MQYGKILNYFTKDELKKLQHYLKDIKNMEVVAVAIIGRVYAENKDLSGNTEAGHFVRVSNRTKTIEGRTVGLLHDIVEDKKINFQDLLLLGFSTDIVSTLQILCRDKLKYPNYRDYITSIIDSHNLIALEIKLYDITDNLSPSRVMQLPEERKKKAVKKYCEALPRISRAYWEIKNEEEYQRRRKIA